MVASTRAAPTLAVVIPTHNRAATVVRAIRSVLDTSGPDVELVVADDGSTDETPNLLQGLADPRIIVLGERHAGGANRARNLGAFASSAPLIAFLDSDDIFLPERTRRLVAFFGRHPEIDCTIDGYVDHSSGREEVHRLPVVADPARLRRMLVAHQVPLTNSTITVRREAFVAIGGYDEALRRHQDRDLLVRLLPRHRIALGDSLDVHKFRSLHSISHEFDGYVDGLDAFAARLPESSDPAYADLFCYLAARGIVKATLQGHLVAAAREARRLGKARHLPHGFLQSLRRYPAGKRFRAALDND